MSKHPETQSVVFDAEPIIIWIDQLTEAATVKKYITDTYHGYINSFISRTNLIEIYYTCIELEDREFAHDQTAYLQDVGIGVVETEAIWEQAGLNKDTYMPNFPLGDAVALAAATEQDLPLLVGDDRHWNDPEADGHDIQRV